MTVAEVVQLHDTSLQDIPAMMRKVADQIEAGEHGEVEAAFLVIPESGRYPHVFAWGNIEGRNDPVIIFELAKAWLLTNLVDNA